MNKGKKRNEFIFFIRKQPKIVLGDVVDVIKSTPLNISTTGVDAIDPTLATLLFISPFSTRFSLHPPLFRTFYRVDGLFADRFDTE